MFELRNIKKSYGNNVIFDGINIKVETGEIVGLIGKSGTGKTTLIKIASLLENVDSGELIIDGDTFDLTHLSDNEVRSIRLKEGLIFQNFNLFKNKTVMENVTEGLVFARNYKKEDAEKAAIEMLDKVGMLHKKNEYPKNLSGGESQRVAIARSLVYNPFICFLDEPTSALDVENKQEVINVLKGIKDNKKTILLVTHEINLVKVLADRVCFINNGKIVEEGNTVEVLENPQNMELKHFLQSEI